MRVQTVAELDRLRPHCATDEAERRVAEHDLAIGRALFEMRSDVHRRARSAVLRRRDDLAGVHGDAQLDRMLRVELPDRIAHGNRRAHGSQRVVLVHPRHTEERHHGIADELLDLSTVRFDCALGCFVVGRHQAAVGLRIQCRCQASRIDDVAEEHRDRAPRFARCSVSRSAEQRGILLEDSALERT